MRILLCSLSLASFASLLGCNVPPKDGVTFHKDIAPIMMSQCASCHQEGGVAPFPLVTAEDAAANADGIATMTAARLMPPSTIDASGACQTFQDARWLTDDEIALIQAWAKAGAPAGDPNDNLAKLPDLESLDDAQVLVAMPTAYTPKETEQHPNDDYRCFLIEAPVAEDAYMTGFEIFPGDEAEVHHMLLFSIMDEDGAADMQALDDGDEGPGWECFSTPFTESTNFLGGWAPGKNVMRYPEDTGIWVAGGMPMVMQIHYNLLAGSRPDLTTVRLTTVPSVRKEAAIVPIADTDLEIPPGQEDFLWRFRQPLAGLADDLEAHGVFPHMHTLGNTLRLAVSPLGVPADDDSQDTCLVDVWRWDFHWQQLWLYEDPLIIRASDVIELDCSYDTRSRTEPTFWGEGTQEEMCLAFIYITRPNGGSLSELIPD